MSARSWIVDPTPQSEAHCQERNFSLLYPGITARGADWDKWGGRMVEANDSGFAIKDFFVLSPIIGTALALIYDVGYFYGVGISYFTLFSLSEHIVFALPALPVALSLIHI